MFRRQINNGFVLRDPLGQHLGSLIDCLSCSCRYSFCNLFFPRTRRERAQPLPAERELNQNYRQDTVSQLDRENGWKLVRDKGLVFPLAEDGNCQWAKRSWDEAFIVCV